MRTKIASILIILFILGFGAIVYYTRPVMNLKNNVLNIPAGPLASTNNNTPTPNPISNSPSENIFAMGQIAIHNNPADCWSTINDSVYDLTDWINRHPGGPQAIESLCGTDGSALFSGQHGRSRRAQSALELLKIGNLQI
ncbi:MAG: hypothetical protein A2538_01185 [Candidatus Magasanikbacteria bacterium RIFOXYD2_FULL_41_14]|uniref:Cytochrome b5 heme-binding domain-containing protein n=1 Tax=Candidatus Magasanikbacteria bacterium RIFOXYD2_FULL_41_14 TaxID=1798709 RepID=A0A1F6PE64_9BACT|nr:MAG: hypothetical protein A2538_01185 [Candidatus Magasanikbacteria bacterium RIFOXYD2_FULL_41_14]